MIFSPIPTSFLGGLIKPPMSFVRQSGKGQSGKRQASGNRARGRYQAIRQRGWEQSSGQWAGARFEVDEMNRAKSYVIQEITNRLGQLEAELMQMEKRYEPAFRLDELFQHARSLLVRCRGRLTEMRSTTDSLWNDLYAGLNSVVNDLRQCVDRIHQSLLLE